MQTHTYTHIHSGGGGTTCIIYWMPISSMRSSLIYYIRQFITQCQQTNYIRSRVLRIATFRSKIKIVNSMPCTAAVYVCTNCFHKQHVHIMGSIQEEAWNITNLPFKAWSLNGGQLSAAKSSSQSKWLDFCKAHSNLLKMQLWVACSQAWVQLPSTKSRGLERLLHNFSITYNT